MKKFIAILLALTSVLSLCACGGKAPETSEPENTPAVFFDDDFVEPTEPTEPTEPEVLGEPTEEELEVLNQYYRYVYFFQDGDLDNESFYNTETDQELYGVEAKNFVYNKLSELDYTIVEKYRGTEYMELVDNYEEYLDYDYKTIMSAFQTFENKLMYQQTTETDRLGNETLKNPNYLRYDAQGNPTNYEQNIIWELLALEPINPGQRYKLEEEYNCITLQEESGKVTEIQYIQNDSGKVAYVVTPSYDDAGRRVQDTIVSNTDEQKILYTYDSNDRVISVYWADMYCWGASSWGIEYTYDEQDRVTSVSRTQYSYGYRFDNPYYTNTVSYTYDDAGRVIQAEHTWEKFSVNYKQTNLYTLSYDAEDRIHTTTIEYGDIYWTYAGTVHENPVTVKEVVENIYGEYYYYTPIA